MNQYKLKSLIREYICKTGLSFPSYSERLKMYAEYREMLATAPVADEPSTFKQYLDWYFNSKKSVNKYEYPMKADCLVSFASLTQCVPQPCYAACDKVCKKEKEVENTMNDATNYLSSRLDTANRAKRSELTEVFNLYAQTNPKTYKDVIDWIKNDKFKIDDKQAKRIDAAIADEEVYYGSFLDGIIWTGAAKVPDVDGYNAADKDRMKRYTAAKDVIMTADATAGLKALQDFEAWTPSTATTVAQ